ncbi:MAG: hypothetical protein KA816_03495, partial [Gemmiger sp.]|nr:hypothetical protein [Gemmiger sp.]
MRYSLHENAPARQQKARANGRKQPFRSGFLILMIGCVYLLRPSYLAYPFCSAAKRLIINHTAGSFYFCSSVSSGAFSSSWWRFLYSEI